MSFPHDTNWKFYYRNEGHWSKCAVMRSPVRAHRAWADLVTDWRGRHPRELLRNLINTWVRSKRAPANWERLLAAARRVFSIRRGRSLVRKTRALVTSSCSPLLWTRLVLLTYTYKYNTCLGLFYQWPVLRHGWHPQGESGGAPFFLAVRDIDSGLLLPHRSRITVLAAAALMPLRRFSGAVLPRCPCKGTGVRAAALRDCEAVRRWGGCKQ